MRTDTVFGCGGVHTKTTGSTEINIIINNNNIIDGNGHDDGSIANTTDISTF